jgi:hypothetical protein
MEELLEPYEQHLNPSDDELERMMQVSESNLILVKCRFFIL